jgi:hypothetical protein
VYLADAFIDVVTCSAGSAKKRRRGKRRKNIPGDIYLLVIIGLDL